MAPATSTLAARGDRRGERGVVEGNAGTVNATFTVSLSAASASTVTVNFATADGSASAGSDYNGASGIVTFAAGQTSQPVVVAVVGDTAAEANETFVVNLSGASGVTILDAQGVGTISNDDAALPPPPLPVAEIPTLSEWGALLLATLLAGLALIAMRRRNR